MEQTQQGATAEDARNTRTAREEMQRINEEQARFYDAKSGERGNPVTHLWTKLRRSAHSVRIGVGIAEEIDQLHRTWLGDLSAKRVLDLGCSEGAALSLEIAGKSKSYLGIDLSRTAVERLRARLKKRGYAHADARVVDFLSPDFAERDFDVIYAQSVAHHFRHFDVFLEAVADRLASNGIVVTFDPLQTSGAVRLFRALYRPFQSDRDWEWPFTKASFDSIQRVFEITDIRGVMGYSKWAIPIAWVSKHQAVKVGKRLHAKDWARANCVGLDLWRCMQVTMCWRKRASK